MNRIVIVAALAVSLGAYAGELAATDFVTVSPDSEIGAIEPMKPVDDGPTVAPVPGEQKTGGSQA